MQLFFHENEIGRAHFVREHLDDRRVDLASLQHRSQHQAHADLGADTDLRVQPAEPAQNAGKRGAGGVLGQAEGNAPRQRRLRQAEQGFVMKPEDANGIVEQVVPRRGEGSRARQAVQKFAAEIRLQSFDLVADGGLGKAERFGRSCDAAVMPDGKQSPQCIDFQTPAGEVRHVFVSRCIAVICT